MRFWPVRIWAFDPGAVATGVAWVLRTPEDHPSEPSWYAAQFADPVDAWNVLENKGGGHDTVLVEMYRSGGHLTKEAMATIEVVGFFKHVTKLGWGWGSSRAIMRVEQHRLSGQRDAAELMGGTIDSLRKDPERKDGFSALAHCITYRRSL